MGASLTSYELAKVKITAFTTFVITNPVTVKPWKESHLGGGGNMRTKVLKDIHRYKV